jgi:translocation and assembly module TamA
MFRTGRQLPLLALAFSLAGMTQLPAPAHAQPDGGDEAATLPTDADGLPQVEPIIPDEEFEEAVPDLDAPLESIEEFERSLEEEVEVEQEVLDEPDLAQPLLPIEEFVETEPPPVVEEPVIRDQLNYSVRLTGLEKADEQTKTNLHDVFDDLSALEDGDGKAANLAMVTARVREDTALLRTILEAHGWYSPAITTRVERVEPADGSNLLAIIDVEPGTRYRLAEITIDAQPTEPPGLISDSLDLRIGEPVVAGRILAAEANVSVVLPQNGYPFSSVGQRDIALETATGDAFYTLPVDTGPRARFGDITVGGDPVFDAEHTGVIARFDRGELYDGRMVDDLRKALAATGLLATVSVEPRRSGVEADDGTEFATIHVEQQPGPPRTIAGSAGYSTGEGLKAEATWTHRNFFPPEGALIAKAVAGTSEQGLGVTFRRSNAGKRDRTVELRLEALHSDFDAYNAYTGRLSGRISRESTPIWHKRFTHAFGFELLATAERDFDFDLGERNRQTYYIAGVNGEVGFDTTNDLLDPVKGFRLTALVQPEGSLNDGFHPYVRARIEGSAYYPVSDGFVLAGRVSFGSIQGVKRADIAPSRRFYSGGGGSVRGYGYQRLGPLDPNGDPLGGRSFNEASAEVRYRFGDYGVVAFVDAGQSYEASLPRFSDLRFGAGIGARYYTNFGPVRVDLATPINRREGENRFNIYVSIGQAF